MGTMFARSGGEECPTPRSHWRVLSIRQPWAWLIVHGPKRLENRTWGTQFRGPILIHASSTMMRSDWRAGCEAAGRACVELPDPKMLLRGGVIGVARLVASVVESDDVWFDGPVGFVLSEVAPVPFIGMRGKLGLFRERIALPCCLYDRRSEKRGGFFFCKQCGRPVW